ncbi:MAG: glycosyltransferase, partial [Candidatus Bathyarchaeota archaeon]|nr:glycosyltransferase [Candidatus Bathyarchaeota archaeon]
MRSAANRREKVSKGVLLSIIVPTYNERENISALIDRIESSLASLEFEIIIVDDNSPDRTAEFAEELNKAYGNIKVVKRDGKFGLSSAVLDGFERAGASILAVLDADLQHPPELLPKIYEKILSGYDIAIASRYVTGSAIGGWSLR